MKKIKQLLANIINSVSQIFTQWKNRKLLARINRFYQNGHDVEEKKLLEAYSKSFRKLIEEEW